MRLGQTEAPRIVERFADLTREVPGLVSATIDLPLGVSVPGGRARHGVVWG